MPGGNRVLCYKCSKHNDFLKNEHGWRNSHLVWAFSQPLKPRLACQDFWLWTPESFCKTKVRVLPNHGLITGKTSETPSKIRSSDKQAGCLLFLTQYGEVWNEFTELSIHLCFPLRMCCFRTRLSVRHRTSLLLHSSDSSHWWACWEVVPSAAANSASILTTSLWKLKTSYWMLFMMFSCRWFPDVCTHP